MSAKRVFVYALVLALLTHVVILALYIHVPRFVESPGTDFVQFYGAALLSGVHPDKIYDRQSQMEIQRQFSAGARNGIHWPYLHAPFFYRASNTAEMVFLCRRVLAVDLIYGNFICRISHSIEPLGADQTTAGQGHLSCGWGGPGTVLADLNRSNHRHRSFHMDADICIHAPRSILLGRICFGFSQLPSTVFDDHPAVAVSPKNVVGSFWI